MKAQILAAAFLIGTAGVAMSADPGMPMEEAPIGLNWTGGYIGVQAGYSFSGNADYIYDQDPESSYNYQHDLDGALAGAYVGYNYQFTNGFVLGGEIDAAWTGIDGSGATPDSGDYSSKTDIDWTGAARLRFGYAMDRFLPYISGGIAVAGINFTEYDEGDFYSAEDFTAVGWTLGAGADWAITDNWVLRGEYRFTKFSGKDFTTQPEDEDYELDDLDMHDIRIGIAYKF